MPLGSTRAALAGPPVALSSHRMAIRGLLRAFLALAALGAAAGDTAAASSTSSAQAQAPADTQGAEWRMGRATHYSAPGDTWTIHDGSCTHKYIWPDIGPGACCGGWGRPVQPLWRQATARSHSCCHLACNRLLPSCMHPSIDCQIYLSFLCVAAGWDAGAMDDQNPEFIGSCGWAGTHSRVLARGVGAGRGAGRDFGCGLTAVQYLDEQGWGWGMLSTGLLCLLPSHRPTAPACQPHTTCRRCYEIKCDPRVFTDGYGASLDRTKVCYDPEASVVIQIVVSWQRATVRARPVAAGAVIRRGERGPKLQHTTACTHVISHVLVTIWSRVRSTPVMLIHPIPALPTTCRMPAPATIQVSEVKATNPACIGV